MARPAAQTPEQRARAQAAGPASTGQVAFPDPLDVRCDGAVLRASGRLTDDLVWFDGHFPGHPVLPGVVWVHWALALAHERLGTGEAPSALEALKFHQPLVPGDGFGLRVERAGAGLLRFEVESEGRRIASGRARVDAAPSAHAAEPPASRRADAQAGRAEEDAASREGWPLRLPQAAPMRLVERVLSHDVGTTLCEARVDPRTPFCRGGSAPSVLALELLAQGMAAQGGIVVGEASGLRALLVGARRIELRTRGFSAGERLWVRVRHLRGETGLVACECALGTGGPPASADEARGRALARGTLTALVESAKD